MKKIITVLLVVNLISAFAGDFEDAELALENKDYFTAIQKYKYSAEHGNSMAYIKLGNMYDAGLGVSQDATEAIKYYKIAAQKGHILGYAFVSVMYENGQGVTKDLLQAERWKNLAKLCVARNLKNCENLDK